MATPNDALAFPYAMSPNDLVDFVYIPGPLLAPGELVSATWSMAISPEGAALGVTIRQDSDYAPQLITGALSLRFWLSVNLAKRQLPDFSDSGVKVQIVVDMTTTNVPPRQFERSLVVTIRQR